MKGDITGDGLGGGGLEAVLSRQAADWPIFGWQEDIRAQLRHAASGGRSVVLATLVRVEGSAPREPGTQMLFDGDSLVGYFTGGCVEGDVAMHAERVLLEGVSRLLRYGAGSPWLDISLRCGGAIEVLVERIDTASEAVRALLDAEKDRTPVVWKSDGIAQKVLESEERSAERIFEYESGTYIKRFEPTRRLVVSLYPVGTQLRLRLRNWHKNLDTKLG